MKPENLDTTVVTNWLVSHAAMNKYNICLLHEKYKNSQTMKVTTPKILSKYRTLTNHSKVLKPKLKSQLVIISFFGNFSIF